MRSVKAEIVRKRFTSSADRMINLSGALLSVYFDDGHVDRVVREQDFADVAEQHVDSLFAVDFLVAVHCDHDGGVELWVVNLEGEIAGDHAVVADPPAVLLEAECVVPVVVVVAQAVPLETFGLQLGTNQCACSDEPGPFREIGDRRDHRAGRRRLARAPRGRVDLVLAGVQRSVTIDVRPRKLFIRGEERVVEALWYEDLFLENLGEGFAFDLLNNQTE
jgi:hypothetical protein